MSSRAVLSRGTKRVRTDNSSTKGSITGKTDDSSSEDESKKEIKSVRATRLQTGATIKPNKNLIDSTDTIVKKEKTSSDTPEDVRVWVICDKCGKWRALPPTVDSASLPDIWYCELNTYTEYNNCAKEEESTADTKDISMADSNSHGLKSFCK